MMKRLISVCLFAAAGLASLGLYGADTPMASGEEGSLLRAFTGGKLELGLRLRFEHVDDDFAPGGATLEQADATTLRTVFGYGTGEFHGLSAYAEMEAVSRLAGTYNDGSNGRTDHAAIIDPDGVELNQGYFSYAGLPDTVLKAGRQIITYRDAPFHRFIGTVLWRQNWQTHDAFTLTNQTLPNTEFKYAYVWRVNRIFGEDAPEPLSHFDSNSHLFNLKYKGLPFGILEAYAYLLDFDNADAFSTWTIGARFQGSRELNEQVKLLYVAEFAHQEDYADNPAKIDAPYYWVEGGLAFKPRQLVDQVTAKIGYEVLGGDGGADRFVTILATGHAFQGWADRFLVTPGDGIEDLIATLAIKAGRASFTAVYHDLSSDTGSYDYGDEIDLILNFAVVKRVSAGLKYSYYDADENTVNVARNGAIGADVAKFWTWVQFNY